MMLPKRRDFLKTGAAAGALAALYGYAGASHLSRHVKAATGTTPGLYRASHSR